MQSCGQLSGSLYGVFLCVHAHVSVSVCVCVFVHLCLYVHLCVRRSVHVYVCVLRHFTHVGTPCSRRPSRRQAWCPLGTEGMGRRWSHTALCHSVGERNDRKSLKLTGNSIKHNLLPLTSIGSCGCLGEEGRLFVMSGSLYGEQRSAYNDEMLMSPP